MGINIRAWLISHELDQMARYLDLVDEGIGQRLDELEESYKADMAREITEDEYVLLEDHYTDAFIDAGNDLPRLLGSSFVVTWYSFVEQTLLELCEQLNLRILLTDTQ